MPLLPPTLVLEHPVWACLDQSNLEEFHPLPWGGFVLQTQAHNVWTVSALAVSRLENKNRRKMKRGHHQLVPHQKVRRHQCKWKELSSINVTRGQWTELMY